MVRENCSGLVRRIPVRSDGSDVTLPLLQMYDKVQLIIKDVFCFIEPDNGQKDIWKEIGELTKRKFGFNVDSDDLNSIHLPRLFKTIIEQLNIKVKQPIRDINFNTLDEFLQDFDM